MTYVLYTTNMFKTVTACAPLIPNFEDGLLPVGTYEVTLDELRASVLVHGCGDLREKNWDTAWRNKLVDNLEIMIKQLWAVGVDEIFIDGSFVEDKDHPNDIDGYFECDLMHLASGKLQQDLNLQEEDKIWIWDPISRTPYKGYPKKQLPMWHKYRVELYPHVPDMGCGIFDKHGNEMEFPAAFRISRRNDEPKGIIKILKGRPL